MNLFARFLSAAVLVCMHVFIGVVQAQGYRVVHCPWGCPDGASEESHLILRPIYALSYNTRSKSADWAAYRITADSVGIASSLSRQPLVDDYVSETLEPADFVSASSLELNRGQYVPLVNFAATPYWKDVNYLTNAVARSNSLSQGPWYGLEWAIRNLVNRRQALYVLTGPIYEEQAAELRLATDKMHQVPDGFFKVVVTPDGGSAVFRFSQYASVGVHHCDLQSSLEEVEALTGLTLFPEREQPLNATLAGDLGCR